MLSFDSTTLAAYRAASTPQGKAQAVSDQLGSGTLTVELRDGATLMYSGTFAGPLVAGADGSLSRDVVPAGLAIVGGTANASTWTCRIRNAAGTRTMDGPIGPGSGHFTLAGPLVVGQGCRLNIAISAAQAPTAIYGLEWDGTGPVVRRLQWTSPETVAPFPIYGNTDGVTYIWKVFIRSKMDPSYQTGYYATFFWGNVGTFFWGPGATAGPAYYGAHPYPNPASPTWPWGPGEWEISINGGDYTTGTEVVWGQWYTQAFRAWRESASLTHHEFYWNLPSLTDKLSQDVTGTTWAATNPPKPGIVMGQAPNNGSASWGGYAGYEELNGILRGIQIYDGLLNTTEILAEIASPKSTTKGANSIWYLNVNPRPSDVTDKSGNGNHPAWATVDKAAEWVG